MSSNGTSINDLPIANNFPGNTADSNPFNSVKPESSTYSPNIDGLPQQGSSFPQESLNNSQVKLDQSTINQIINGIQQASITGSTQLQSRDIPTTTMHLSQDPHSIPTYVPPPPSNNQNDYISTHEYINTPHQRPLTATSNLDYFLTNYQIPILLALLYFVFQLPFVKINVGKYMPYLLWEDGNFNIYGLICISIAFGFSYHFLGNISGIHNY